MWGVHRAGLGVLAAVLVVVGLGLGACASAPGVDSSSGEAVTFQCGDLRVETRTLGSTMELLLPGETRVLSLTRSASGARYADGRGTVFWNRGAEAMFMRPGFGTSQCVVTEARSPWIEARERGIVYRAVGQEPGWLVEVGEGEHPRVVISLDYGSRALELPRAAPLAEGSGFQGLAGTEAVTLRIMPGPCRDSMSGELFESRAELRVGDTLYEGCGSTP